ncbi:ribosome-recycling factor, mitochondrial isoform X2 [Anthonomus grandis grandis]|uniref:ribosome-recycling factor, mitochondrial isoform X2 n=1 Tax=Anthonomus grandis grandis TaxID=2921223 RepID=UPI0021662E06|nr:ribosome-recycling factor, mitochondrial isoform X2 [Anthonomus grandis grandis]
MFSTTKSLPRIFKYLKSGRNSVLTPMKTIQKVPNCCPLSTATFTSNLTLKHGSYFLISSRSYAKGKDKKKDKGKGKAAKVEINEAELSGIINLENLKNHMQKAIQHMEEDFVKNLSLRSTTGSIESIVVQVDGTDHKLQELAQIIRKNPKTIVVNFTNFPQVIPAALKALAKSGMNLNPQQDGTTLFIPIPKVNKEHREQLSKNAKQLFVKCKDSVRDVQVKHIKQIKRQEKLSEDLARSAEQQIIAIADQFISEAEGILNSKQSELLGEK